MSDRFDLLTARELEVLRLAAEGLTPKVIALQLALSDRTIYVHLGNAAKKLGVSSPREAAVLLARRDCLGAYAKPAEQSLQVVPTGRLLLDLLLPELSGKRFNDLSVARRLVVIGTRMLLIAVTMFAVATIARDVGIIVGQPR